MQIQVVLTIAGAPGNANTDHDGPLITNNTTPLLFDSLALVLLGLVNFSIAFARCVKLCLFI